MNQIGKEEYGIKLFFHILKKLFFTLVFLNLIFIVTCIPIITIGPACKAMSKVTMDMVRDKSFGVVQSYFLEFKKDFLKTAGVGILVTVVLGVMGYSILINLQGPELTTLLRIFVIFSIVIMLYASAVLMYVLKLLATIDLPMKEIWKNSVLLVFMSPKQMILLLFLIVAPTILAVIYLQIGISFFLIWHFSMASLVSSINGWNIIKKYVVAENQETEK